eukprot:TRINITY_DN3537_c2_g1_i1.p1 TRINITY_DN3537_c2_g1~~TRINITY_DN3537_c2_g1_i1.p1  ORF type:complete len:111 (+),score=0.86 TRINITY_DN3537_c2_g1_i1:348-680(+)
MIKKTLKKLILFISFFFFQSVLSPPAHIIRIAFSLLPLHLERSHKTHLFPGDSSPFFSLKNNFLFVYRSPPPSLPPSLPQCEGYHLASEWDGQSSRLGRILGISSFLFFL